MENLSNSLFNCKNNNCFSLSKFEIDYEINEIFSKFFNFEKHDLDDSDFRVRIAGRIMRIRNFGKLCFIVLRDSSGDIQLVFVNESNFRVIDLCKNLNVGDIIGIFGKVFKTDKKELSVRVISFELLSKCSISLPDFHYGFNDVEERFRNRHIDFIFNRNSFNVLILRSKIIKLVRNFFDDQKFIEMETPILVSKASGAQAKPFITYHNKLSRDLFLRIAPEISLKTILIGWCGKIYEIGKSFRNEGIDTLHTPEFTTIEFYISYEDYNTTMNITEKLFNFLFEKLFSNEKFFNFNGNEIKLNFPFKKISMIESIKLYTGIDFEKIDSLQAANEIAQENKIEVDLYNNSIGHITYLFFEKFVEKNLINPTFVYDYPIEVSPLAKADINNEKFAKRFELFIGGVEFANGYNELNDPDEQEKRFSQQMKEKALGNSEIAEGDSDYVRYLKCGLPPACGGGIGIDRVVMLFSESKSIREVIPFPQMKNIEKNTKL